MLSQQIKKSVSSNRETELEHKTSQQIMQFPPPCFLLILANSLDLLQHESGTICLSFLLSELSVICLPRKPKQSAEHLQACPVAFPYFHHRLGPDFFLIGM